MIGYAASGWTGVNTGIPAVLGPMGQSVRDLTLFTKVARASQPWKFDPAIIPGIMEAPFPEPTRKPIIGILGQSGLTPHPPVRRAIREAKAKLQAAGYETRDFDPLCPNFHELRQITRQLFTIDGLSYPKLELARAGEPVVPSVPKIGFWQLPRKSHEEVWELNTKKGALQKKMLDAWQHLEIDLLITPAGPHTALTPGDWINDMYTVVWNAMDYPAVIIPFTKANLALDLKDADFEPLHEEDEKCQAFCKSILI